jgi:hypothetical protein
MKKKFDAVNLQREIRERLSKKYAPSREAELEELKKKFAHLRKQKAQVSSR